MKRTVVVIMLAVMLVMTGCTFHGNKSDEKYTAMYQPVIDEFYKLASASYDFAAQDENEIPEGGTAILEGSGWGSSDCMLWESGFTIRDLSGDKIPELVIGSVSEEGYGTAIYAIYTIADNQPYFILDGVYRNMYYLLEDGSIFNQGSAGAAYSISGLYDFSKDGKTLLCRDYWFTHEIDGNFEDIRCWHNTTGEMNIDVSEELDMTLEAFWDMEGQFLDQVVTIEMTTFGEYGGVEKSAYEANPTVEVVYESEYTGEYDEYVIDNSGYATQVVFTTDSTVRDFKLIALNVTDISEDGAVSFAYDDLYFYGELTPERGLAVMMNLPEIIPYYAVSYMDGTGDTRVFSVNLSGYDGSVYLEDITGVG